MRSKSMIVSTLVAVSMLAASATSHAAVAIASFAFGGAPQGVLAAAAGAFVLVDTANSPSISRRTAGLIVGLILLDGSEGQTYVYKPVSSDEAKTLNISENERVAYNSQLDEINDIRESVIADMSQMKNPTIADARADWENYTSSLSPAAVSALSKVSSQAIQQ